MANNQNYEFQTCSEHKRPVAAGTVVVFTVEPPPEPGRYLVEWHIEGPFTGVGRVVGGGLTYDWDTQGERAGSYSVFARLTDTRAVPPAAPQPTAPPAAADGVPGLGGLEGMTAPADRATGGGPAGAPRTAAAVTTTNGAMPSQDAEAWKLQITPAVGAGSDGIVPVSLQRTGLVETVDQALWVIIRDRTNAISFRPYRTFIDDVMGAERVDGVGPLPFRGGDAYALLKFATDAFLMQEVGVLDPFGVIKAGLVNPTGAARLNSELALQSLEEQLDDPTRAEALRAQESRRLGHRFSISDIRQLRDNYYQELKEETPPPLVLPYLRDVRDRLADIPLKPAAAIPRSAYGILRSHLTAPLAVELFWSYWHEEGWLAQTLHAILARFQNRRITPDGRPDPLARFDIDPLRPLGNLMWGFAQDEVSRLTVRRRHFEYEHEYGLQLHGRAIPREGRPVDRRSAFLESLHNLLYLSHVFFKEDDDTTVIADGFPVLNALRETHLLLAEGAHNQFGDLPSAARAEMLVMQWLLARPELRDFLGGRTMVPYEEGWMDRVDTMKTLQGATDVNVTHFRDMGVFGEQILLSIRYGNWNVENDPQTAANWARYWRPELQRYVHAYRSATGVDLTDRIDATMPAILLRRRLASQRRELDPGQQHPMLEGRRDSVMQGGPSRRVPVQRELE